MRAFFERFSRLKKISLGDVSIKPEAILLCSYLTSDTVQAGRHGNVKGAMIVTA